MEDNIPEPGLGKHESSHVSGGSDAIDSPLDKTAMPAIVLSKAAAASRVVASNGTDYAGVDAADTGLAGDGWIFAP